MANPGRIWLRRAWHGRCLNSDMRQKTNSLPRAHRLAPTVDDHTHWGKFRAQLGESIGAGAALAALTLATACGGQGTGEPIATGSGGLGNDSDTQLAGGAGGALNTSSVPVPVATLEPYPLADIGCFGPIVDNPLYGPQCCFEARCYVPLEGAACASDFQTAPEVAALRPLGSGWCGCEVREEGRPYATGPYAANPAAESPFPAGACCYVVGAWGCAGRPFVFAGVGHLAAVAQRSDWGLLG